MLALDGAYGGAVVEHDDHFDVFGGFDLRSRLQDVLPVSQRMETDSCSSIKDFEPKARFISATGLVLGRQTKELGR